MGEKETGGRGRIPKSGTLAKAPAERDHRCGPGLQMRMKNTQRRVKTGKSFFNACYLSVRWNEYFLSRWKSGTAFSGTKIRNFFNFFQCFSLRGDFAFGRSLCGVATSAPALRTFGNYLRSCSGGREGLFCLLAHPGAGGIDLFLHRFLEVHDTLVELRVGYRKDLCGQDACVAGAVQGDGGYRHTRRHL